MSDHPIRTEGLTKVYDSVKAVDALDLTVDGGQVFGFLGPTGIWKQTTINFWESLSLKWGNLIALVLMAIASFAVSYVAFMRTDIR